MRSGPGAPEDVIELLRARGADPHRRTNHAVSPLDLSRTIDSYDVAQWLEEHATREVIPKNAIIVDATASISRGVDVILANAN